MNVQNNPSANTRRAASSPNQFDSDQSQLSTLGRLRGGNADSSVQSRMAPPPQPEFNDQNTASDLELGYVFRDESDEFGELFNEIGTPRPSSVQSAPNSTPAVVNTLTFPTNDWYEVQSASTFETITEGRESAELPNGTYNIINHTTGERVENFILDSAPTPAAPTNDTAIDSRDGASKPASVTVSTVVGDVTITVTPEAEWGEVATDVAIAAASAGGPAAIAGGRLGAQSGGGLPAIAGGAVIAGAGAGVGAGAEEFASNVDTEVEIRPNWFTLGLGVMMNVISGTKPKPKPEPVATPVASPTTTKPTQPESEQSTITVHKPDNSATNSPVTNTTTTFNSNGEETGTSTTVTTPTGLTIGPAPAPAPAPNRQEHQSSQDEPSNSGGSSGSTGSNGVPDSL